MSIAGSVLQGLHERAIQQKALYMTYGLSETVAARRHENFLNTEFYPLETCRPQAMNHRPSPYALHVRHPWLDGETDRQARLSTTSSCLPHATRETVLEVWV